MTDDDLRAALVPPFVLTEDRLAPGRPVRLWTDPVAILTAATETEVAETLDFLEAVLGRGLHAAGFLAYELGRVFEPHPSPHPAGAGEVPLLRLGLFGPPRLVEGRRLDAVLAERGPPPPLADLAFGHDRATHVAAVRHILDRLAAGDAYQVDLTFPIDFRWSGDPLALWAALRAAQPVAHGGVVALGPETIVSVSPECFLTVEGGRLTTRPMKGTAPRGSDPASDAAARAALHADPKQRAENLMIVDLMRNDLSRVAEIGSVAVPELFRVETYPTLHTMTSTVTARLRRDVGTADLLAAVFPCGSITGAPKRMAMTIAAELEARPRGVYTGAIGSFGPDGAVDLAVAIRTATLFPDGRGTWGVGGGIVADSDPDREYDEALLKGRVLTGLAEDFGLIETLRWSRTEGFVRLARHLDRLAASAAALGFAFDRAALETDLAALVAPLGGDAPHRIRIELARDGATTLAAPPLVADPDRPLRIGFAPDPVDAGDPHLRHKTTRRTRFDAAAAAARERGLDDVLFVNRDGFVTESTRADLFVEKDGRLLTPALRHGLLPGVLRAELVATGRAIEADLRREDLAGARLFLGNALRGLKGVTLAE